MNIKLDIPTYSLMKKHLLFLPILGKFKTAMENHHVSEIKKNRADQGENFPNG